MILSRKPGLKQIYALNMCHAPITLEFLYINEFNIVGCHWSITSASFQSFGALLSKPRSGKANACYLMVSNPSFKAPMRKQGRHLEINTLK